MHQALLAVLSNHLSEFVIVTWPPGHQFPFTFLNIIFVQLLFVPVEKIQTKYYCAFLCFSLKVWCLKVWCFYVSIVPGIARYYEKKTSNGTSHVFTNK